MGGRQVSRRRFLGALGATGASLTLMTGAASLQRAATEPAARRRLARGRRASSRRRRSACAPPPST
jgi:hypothetical protein